MAEKRLAVIRIRGTTGVKKPIADTLSMLSLYTKNSIVIVPNNPVFTGMVKKVKDFVTYGEVAEDVVKSLSEKRKNTSENKSIMAFTLNSPRGGFERKGIKVAFSHKGALGYRGEKISDLIKRMM
jgi:large subunit ribosomal protein L30